MSGSSTISGRGTGEAPARDEPARPAGPPKGALTPDQQRRHRRRVVIAVVTGVLVVLGGLIGYAVYRTQVPSRFAPPAHATKDSSGIFAGGSGKVTVDIYADYMCAHCGAFSTAASPVIDQMIAENRITLIVHPLALLDSDSTTQYSTRAASSAACAADMSHVLDYTQGLFAAQPKPGGAGLSDDQLIQIGGRAGIIDPRFAQCVRGQKYKGWVAQATRDANADEVAGAPTVQVNGVSIAPPGGTPTVAELTAAVNAATGAPAK